MDREQVDALLRDYRDNIGRCGHLRVEIRRNELRIERARAEFRHDAAGPGVSRMTGMPRGTAPGDPTAALGLMLAGDEVPEDSPQGREIARLRLEIARQTAELDMRQTQVDFVNCWLEGLTERERWVIERHIIDREIWYDVMLAFTRRYADDISKDRLKRLQARALERIYSIAM